MDAKEQEQFKKKWQEFIEGYINNDLKSRNSESNSNNEVLRGKSELYILKNLKSNDTDFDKEFKQELEKILIDFFKKYHKENTNYEIHGVKFYYSFQNPLYHTDTFSFETY